MMAMQQIHEDIFNVFGAVLSETDNSGNPTNLMMLDHGIILDTPISTSAQNALRKTCKPLNMRTLFSVEERNNASVEHLLTKQILHYIEVYGLNQPGTFDLEVDGGKIVTCRYVRSMTRGDLAFELRKLLAANAPIKDVESIKRLVKFTGLSYAIDDVANNEARIALFDPEKDTFKDGDDVVRWICYKCADSPLLIKSPEVIKALKASWFTDYRLLRRHIIPLAEVFNRHKPLLLAIKNDMTKAEINKISRLSKKLHVPIRESVSKRYVSGALSGAISKDALSAVSTRDKMKFLNLLAYKKAQNETDAFVIRNGKIHVAKNRPVWDLEDISRVESDIIDSLRADLGHLNGKSILLDPRVRYGLPTSRKQTMGHLPFGTTIDVAEGDISSGIYWEDAGGATDLDLSTIDVSGIRTGWGTINGYSNRTGIKYSGDEAYAENGAMEFMTSRDKDYGLFVNVFSGTTPATAYLVVGNQKEGRWIKDPIIREEITLTSRGTVLGFVRGKQFTVFQGRISDSMVSGEQERSVVARGMADFWTINRLFDVLGVNYSLDNDPEIVYDYDMRYNRISYDKLEKLMNI